MRRIFRRPQTLRSTPFDRGPAGENPYQIQYDLQESMQSLVGIVRTESEMQQALDTIGQLRARADRAGIAGHRQYNNGWHTAMDLAESSDRIRGHHPRRRCFEKRAGARSFAKTFLIKMPNGASTTSSSSRGADGEMQVERRPLQPMPDELKAVIEEMK